MSVKCLAQGHNAVHRLRLEPGLFDPESSPLTIRPPRHPQGKDNPGGGLSSRLTPYSHKTFMVTETSSGIRVTRPVLGERGGKRD